VKESQVVAIPVTVIVLTLNEELVIKRALRSVKWAGELMVVDSGSTDRTREEAREEGAVVIDQEWLGWARQRQTAAARARHEWVFFLDADEIVTPRLAESIRDAFSVDPDPRDGFSMDRRGDFLGVLLPNESRAAKRRSFVRIYNRRCSGWKLDDVHEEVELAGRGCPLQGVLLHWRGYQLDEYIPVFDRYATVEAASLHRRGVRASGSFILLRPIMRFGWLYFIRGDWRLGTRGLIHAMLKSFQEFLRYAKLWERDNARVAVSDPPADVQNPQ
jgi:(heptosyl)LPS beta-1,4-glucosyltransferase